MTAARLITHGNLTPPDRTHPPVDGRGLTCACGAQAAHGRPRRAADPVPWGQGQFASGTLTVSCAECTPFKPAMRVNRKWGPIRLADGTRVAEAVAKAARTGGGGTTWWRANLYLPRTMLDAWCVASGNADLAAGEQALVAVVDVDPLPGRGGLPGAGEVHLAVCPAASPPFNFHNKGRADWAARMWPKQDGDMLAVSAPKHVQTLHSVAVVAPPDVADEHCVVYCDLRRGEFTPEQAKAAAPLLAQAR